jgi:hypothetical protein
MGWNAISRLAASRVEAFAAVAEHLLQLGLSAPAVYDQDIPRGLALLEDLGDDLFARVIEAGGDEIELYTAAGEVLAAVHRAPAPFTRCRPISTSSSNGCPGATLKFASTSPRACAGSGYARTSSARPTIFRER